MSPRPNRGEVWLVDLGMVEKVRPALVVQNDRDNQSIRKTVIALITGNLRRQGDPSHLLVDPASPAGASSGLGFPSLISCYNLFTIEQDSILQVIGHLSDALKPQLADCLKAALELP